MDKKLITMKELQDKLQMSRTTIYRLSKEGMPRYEVSRKNIKYDYDEVLKWLKDRGK